MEDINEQGHHKDGSTYNKWQQLYLLLNEWMEEEAEEGNEFDEGYAVAILNVLEAINNLNEGKYPYDIH